MDKRGHATVAEEEAKGRVNCIFLFVRELVYKTETILK